MGFVAFHLKDRKKKRGSDVLGNNKLYECCTISTHPSAEGQQIQQSQMRAVPVVPALLPPISSRRQPQPLPSQFPHRSSHLKN